MLIVKKVCDTASELDSGKEATFYLYVHRAIGYKFELCSLHIPSQYFFFFIAAPSQQHSSRPLTVSIQTFVFVLLLFPQYLN